jgi:hypothetical protein
MPIAEIQRMLEAHPSPGNVDRDLLARCIDESFACAQTCTSCADACLSEKDMVTELRKCIRLNLDCADICEATGRVLIRQTEYDVPLTQVQLQACREACATWRRSASVTARWSTAASARRRADGARRPVKRSSPR